MDTSASPVETAEKRKRDSNCQVILHSQGGDAPPNFEQINDLTLTPKHPQVATPETTTTDMIMPGATGPEAVSTALSPCSSAAEANVSSYSHASPMTLLSPPHVLIESSCTSADKHDVLHLDTIDALQPGLLVGKTEKISEINKQSGKHVGLDAIDPLGLFDELEGPLDWPLEGLFD